MKNLTILLSVSVMIVNSGQAQENVKVSNADIKNSILGQYSVYDGSNKEIFLGDYSQINYNEEN